MFRSVISAALAFTLIGLGAAADDDDSVTITSDTFGGIQARAIGPALMSGRIAAIDAVPGAPTTIWAGTASGGVWKSEDGGVTFEAVFDDDTQSIGAITVDPSNEDTVWVGTGETWVRNSVSVGDGVYRTTDGGDDWEHLGLEETERIARIIVDPSSSLRVFVCATGHLWNSNDERGVYRSTDGGASWEKTLFVDADTGCSDLAMDPQDAQILYAGMWQFRRSPDFFNSGGPGSGLYRSLDGGDSWHELTSGLPDGDKGRIAVAVAPSRASRVYALVEADDTALYRSDDLGNTFEEVTRTQSVTGRPFYFATLTVHPTDHDTVYKPDFSLAVSSDGGETFTSPFIGGGGAVHGDYHAVWVNPARPSEIIVGTDGGLYISHDEAHHFIMARSLPVSQFYHVSVDMEQPYNVYGGLQDNGSWMGPSRSPGGIRNHDWKNVGYGDGFWVFPDPTDSDILYSEYQGGRLLRVRKSLSEIQSIHPYEGEGEEELRFNWNAPIHLSETHPGRMYYGAQYLFRSHDRGDSWERISPDLTTDDPQRQRQEESGGLSIDNTTAENNATIYAISESPLDDRTIWVGTDDGRLQLTQDGAETWTDVFTNLPQAPEGTWVSSVQASRHQEGRAFATLDGHRTGDMTPYVFRTEDFGTTWQSLASDNLEGYARVVREDVVNPDLLFLGTEHGLWLSLDGGLEWARFEGNMPPVAVHDIVIHPREHDLVVATHGRGIYIIDDLTPIRALTTETLASNAALLPARPAQMRIGASLQDFGADDEFVGRNPREAAIITYWLKKRHIFGDLKIEVYDHDGELIKTIPGEKRVGINRVAWPMRLKPPKVPPASSLVPAFVGPRVAEGSYTVKLIKGKDTYEGQVELVADARSPHSAEDRALQQVTAMQLYKDLENMTYLIDSVVSVRDAARERAEELEEKSRLAEALNAWADDVEAFRAGIVSTSDEGRLSGEEELREKIGDIYGAVSGFDGRPTDSQLARAESLRAELAAETETFAELTSDRLYELNHKLEKADLEPITIPSRDEWEAEEEGAAPSGTLARLVRAKSGGWF